MINETFIVVLGDSKSYQNQGGIGFYGEYIFPEKPPLEKKEEKVVKNSNINSQKPSQISLPRTGEKMMNVSQIEILIVVLVAVVIVKKRRNHLDENK